MDDGCSYKFPPPPGDRRRVLDSARGIRLFLPVTCPLTARALFWANLGIQDPREVPRSEPFSVLAAPEAAHAARGLVSPCAPFGLAANMPKDNMQIENMDEADFMTLGRWLMGNTKDMEVRGTPGRLGTHPPADQRALLFVPGS